ncbi:alpha-taxilin-like protein [Perilla frutescens var. hirtella]|uniref:Alpha-taxilin-like protein n=1 Tax=Perilla frutescens var. hirtella TaxID=608512 RepID=A0AAD4JQL3_PERFH|nr:alpha-taxilin-like protein [Perilla frutescens var. hirtella]
MGDPSSNPNPEANQLPEADSLPDGFVESSSAAEEVVDYKEEKLLEPGSRPEVVIEDGGSSLGKLVEHVADQSKSTTAANAGVTRGDGNAKEKSVEGAETLSVTSEEIAAAGSAENNKKEAPEVKRKNVKRTFKSEKEFLEFTLKYQQVITERDSAIAVRDKLESLCRELQRQNKLLMDECKRVSTEGQNLRLDLSNRFQDAIKEVSFKLEEQKDECIAQLKENEMLKIKLKQLVDQYTLSEQQHAQQQKQKTLELQLSDLKLQQHEEKLKQEQAQMKLYAEQVAQLLATEKNLRLQLTADGEKFQQFQEALLKSNEVFETFKQEIEKMAKSIKDLKKENTFLKSKSEKSDITLIELANEREHLKKQLEKTRNQKDKLESLCRSLQAERKTNSTASNSSD